jgi:protein PhnA
MSIDNSLLERSHSKCELCSSDSDISAYEVPHSPSSHTGAALALCSICLGQIENHESIDVNHWHCLNESMWSEFPAVQVTAWRVLKGLSAEGWAQDLLEQLYLEEEVLAWAQVGVAEANENTVIVKDSNGAALSAGDTVTLIKDLVVKGANFTAKRGTIVKNISLTDNPLHVEGRVNGTTIVLVSAFLKKAN